MVDDDFIEVSIDPAGVKPHDDLFPASIFLPNETTTQSDIKNNLLNVEQTVLQNEDIESSVDESENATVALREPLSDEESTRNLGSEFQVPCCICKATN